MYFAYVEGIIGWGHVSSESFSGCKVNGVNAGFGCPVIVMVAYNAEMSEWELVMAVDDITLVQGMVIIVGVPVIVPCQVTEYGGIYRSHSCIIILFSHSGKVFFQILVHVFSVGAVGNLRICHKEHDMVVVVFSHEAEVLQLVHSSITFEGIPYLGEDTLFCSRSIC